MSSDIVERLRELEQVEHELAHDCDCPPEATVNWKYAETCREAVAEIERLRAGIGEMLLEREDARAEVKRLRAALHDLVGRCMDDFNDGLYLLDRARAALEEGRT